MQTIILLVLGISLLSTYFFNYQYKCRKSIIRRLEFEKNIIVEKEDIVLTRKENLFVSHWSVSLFFFYTCCIILYTSGIYEQWGVIALIILLVLPATTALALSFLRSRLLKVLQKNNAVDDFVLISRDEVIVQYNGEIQQNKWKDVSLKFTYHRAGKNSYYHLNVNGVEYDAFQIGFIFFRKLRKIAPEGFEIVKD